MRKKAVRSVQRDLAQQAESPGAGVLILVELGAEWPQLTLEEGAPRRVFAQRDGEAPAQFSDRVGAQLDALFGRGVALGSAVIASNERLDPAAEATRRKLAGLALGAMARHKTGQVKLTASERSSARLRQALTNLSQGLHDEWRTAGLEVSVKIGEERNAASQPQVFAFTARVA